MKSKYNLALAIFLICFATIAGARAMDWDDKLIFVKDPTTLGYGKYEIYNSVFMGIGIGEKLQDYELLYNEASIINAYAIGTSNIYEDNKLFNGVDFEGQLQAYKIYYLKEIIYDAEKAIISEVCRDRTDPNGKESYSCMDEITGWTTEKKTKTDWVEYKEEILSPGSYTWKIEGKLYPNKKVDWVAISGAGNKRLDNWLWWDNSWSRKKEINITSGDPTTRANVSVLINISYDSDMKADFGDLRFVDGEEDDELYYWFDDNTYITSNSVLVWVKLNRNISTSANVTIYMYYGNSGASTTSNISTAFRFGDDFFSVDFTNKWYASNEALYVTNGSVLNCTATNNFNTEILSTHQNFSSYIMEAKHGRWVAGSNSRIEQHPLPGNWNNGQEENKIDGDGTVYAYVGNANTNKLVGGTEWFRAVYKLNGIAGNNSIRAQNKSMLIEKVGNTAGSLSVLRTAVWSYSSGVSKVDWVFIRGYIALEPTYIFGEEKSENDLAITLNSPDANYNSSSRDILFNCTGTDETGVINLSLFIDDVLNYTVYNSTAGENLTLAETIVNIPEGAHNWTCEVTDSQTSITAGVRVFNVDATAPVVVINEPSGADFLTPQEHINISLNISVTDNIGVSSCWYYNGTHNISITCGNNATIKLGAGFNTLGYFANDSLNNIGNASITFFINRYNYTVGYGSKVVEGDPSTFTLYLSATNLSEINSNFTYDSTVYNLSTTTNGTYSQINKTITIPEVSGDSNKTFNFTFIINNGASIKTGDYGQSVYNLPNPVLSGECTVKSINFTLKDEANFTILNGSFDYNFAYGTSDNSTKARSFGTLTGLKSVYFCINNTIGDNFTIGAGEIFYTSDNYVDRRYYIFNGTVVSNATINITLYSLESIAQTSFQLEIEDTSLNPYVAKYASLIRYYPNLNEYNTVDMGETDEKGETVIHVRVEDVDYRIGVYEKNGSLIKLAEPIRMVCLVTPCTYTLRISPTEIDYTSFLNIQTSFTYNTTTSIWRFIWADTSGNTQSMNLTIYKVTGTDIYPICSSTVSGATGSVTCNTSAYTGTLKGVVYRSASPEVPIAQKIINVGTAAFTSQYGLFITLLLAIPIAFITAFISPIGAVIGGVLLLIPGIYLGSINWAIFSGIAILGGIIMHFLKRIG